VLSEPNSRVSRDKSFADGSTADAAQIFIRIDEEMDNIKRKRVSLGRDREELDDPVAILTDIIKAILE